ncbi:MAG TPA: MFS transporter [Trebonia sp.]|nr:MFS transporter [Trebonia sp.]
MRMSDALRRAEHAAQATGRAFRSGTQASGRATRGTGRFVHRITGAQGMGRTGLATLIETTAVSGAADAFVTIALAGTIFFSSSVDQARGRVVLFLIITMAPFAVLAPFIGPALDRIQQGRRFVLAGTMLARGLLCYAMSANVANSVTLLPAAFGILVLQKAGGVVKASVTPRLLPAEITLVTANARSGLISLAASTVAAILAAGVQIAGGAAWTLRIGTLIYLAAMVIALRLPEQIDIPPAAAAPSPDPRTARAPGEALIPGEAREARRPRQETGPHQAPGAGPREAPAPGPRRGYPPGAAPGAGDRPRRTLPLEPGALPSANGHGAGRDHAGRDHAGRGRWRTLASVGPVVSEAMAVNAVLRAFAGYVLFLLAFLLRSLEFGPPGHPVSHNFALGVLAVGLSTGSLAAMLLGSFFRGRAPHLIMFSVLTIAPVITIVCAVTFGLWAAAAVEFTAIFCASLAKLGQDSIVQREIGDEIRSSTFAVSETLNQVANVAGGLAGVLVSMLDNGQAGLAIAAGGLVVALFLLLARRRQRVRGAARAMPQPAGSR